MDKLFTAQEQEAQHSSPESSHPLTETLGGVSMPPPPLQLQAGSADGQGVVQRTQTRSEAVAGADGWVNGKKTVDYGGMNREVTKAEALDIYNNGTPGLDGTVYRAIHTPIVSLQKNCPPKKSLKQHIMESLPERLAAPQPESDSLVFKHIGASNGMYLSTSKSKGRAAKYAALAWNQATVDQGAVKPLKDWSPIASISVPAAAQDSSPAYDMTDELTRASLLALEVTDPEHQGQALMGAIENALLDEEVIYSGGISKVAIRDLDVNFDSIAAEGHGPNSRPGWLLNTDDSYDKVHPDAIPTKNSIVDISQRPQWSGTLLRLSEDWKAFLATEPGKEEQDGFFSERIDSGFQQIYSHLQNERNLDRDMTYLEFVAFQRLLRATHAYYEDMRQQLAMADEDMGLGSKEDQTT